MMRVVGIGACVADTLYRIPSYPTEDTKCRATESKQAGGGPVATGLVAAAKLGAQTAFLGNLSTDAAGQFLKADFEKYGVDTSKIHYFDGCRSFASVLWLCADSGTRTCVFDKGDLPALRLDDAQKEAIRRADLLMVDGNELEAAIEAAKIAKEAGTAVLYDCGGRYAGVDRLLPLCDYLIPSEEFALGVTGCATAEEAAKQLFDRYQPRLVVVTQGKKGGVYYDGEKTVRYPIYPANVVDSNGSGDVFHGAFAAAVLRGFSYESCCHFASATSAIKCMGVGARESVPDYDTVVKYLKENGYEL